MEIRGTRPCLCQGPVSHAYAEPFLQVSLGFMSCAPSVFCGAMLLHSKPLTCSALAHRLVLVQANAGRKLPPCSMLHECFRLKQGQELRPGMLDALNLIAGRAARMLPRGVHNRSRSLQAWGLSDV